MATEPLPSNLSLPSVTPAQSAAPFSGRVQLVALESIRVPERRVRMRSDVDALRESIAANGLLQPVLVDENFSLVCGLLRLEAARQLGWREMPAIVRALPANEAKLAEVDENLCRRELSVLERAEHIALRRKLWEELRRTRDALAPANDTAGAKAKDSKAAAKKKAQADKRADEASLAAFVDDTSKKAGRAQAAIREELKIGELPEEVRELAKETPIVHNRRELLALARMEDDERLPAIERVRSGESKSVRKPKPKKVKPEDVEEGLDDEAGASLDEIDVDSELSTPKRKKSIVRDDTPAPSSEEIRDRLQRMLGGLGPEGEEPPTLPVALERAVAALEVALALWPEGTNEVGEDGEPSGHEVLRQAVRAVRRLAAETRG